jgi:hypothetical protein
VDFVDEDAALDVRHPNLEELVLIGGENPEEADPLDEGTVLSIASCNTRSLNESQLALSLHTACRCSSGASLLWLRLRGSYGVKP